MKFVLLPSRRQPNMQNPFAALAKPQPSSPKGGSTSKKKKNRRKNKQQQQQQQQVAQGEPAPEVQPTKAGPAFDSSKYQQETIPADAEVVIVDGQKFYFPRTVTPNKPKEEPASSEDDEEEKLVPNTRSTYTGAIQISFEGRRLFILNKRTRLNI